VVAGAFAAAPEDPSAVPTCADPDELLVSCAPPDEPPPPPDAAVAVLSPDWLAPPPLFEDAAVTGALAVTGASAATPASGEAEPTWAAPFVPVAFWVCALAMPGHRATARIAAVAADALRNIKFFQCSLLGFSNDGRARFVVHAGPGGCGMPGRG
jgi:hypothetical protein